MYNNNTQKTKYENLKFRLTEIYNTLLEAFENDIESGIDDGIYNEADNKDNRALIKEAKHVIEAFSNYTPAIYFTVEGHQIQGFSATEGISINKFDDYDYKNAPEEQEMTPEAWEQMIKEQTNNLEIRWIF